MALNVEGLGSAVAGWSCYAEDVLLPLHGATARCMVLLLAVLGM